MGEEGCVSALSVSCLPQLGRHRHCRRRDASGDGEAGGRADRSNDDVDDGGGDGDGKYQAAKAE